MMILRARGAAVAPAPILVFDIDGTALDDRPGRGMQRHEPVYQLYMLAGELGYRIVFLTGRLATGKPATARALTEQGYSTWHDLVMFPGSPTQQKVPAVAKFKDSVRSAYGPSLLACIGDQDMDVVGQYVGQHQWRLPEPPPHAQCSVM